MTTIDIILGVILLIAFYFGYKKGLFVTLASLIGLIAGVYGAIHFSHIVGNWLSERYDWSIQTTNIVAFAVTFLIIVFVISLAGKFLTKVADFAALGLVNKLLGGVFSMLKYAFIVSVVFMLVDASDSYRMVSMEERETSVLYPPVASLAPLVLPQILEEVDDFRNDPPEVLEEYKQSDNDSLPSEASDSIGEE
ncbi:CvpA family protein [Luteirhabdus pelagi]|uniref:CvpA family protein n=1 Tax=Luteirhabdus pelagi TaxID=2792783 RepID=UPI001939C245|nr:CvpA family protein [Luteirhabdus pelagi]